MGKLELFRSVIFGIIVCLSGIMQIGCGGSQGDIPPVGVGNEGDSFSFQTLPESLVDGASSEFTHNVIRTDSAVAVEIEAQMASNLKALYFELDYDAEAYHPVAVEYTDVLGETGELLTIDVTNHPGKVFCGQVLKNYPAQLGFTGSGTLAIVRFEEGAVPHTASVPPVAESSKVIPHFIAPGVVSWLYCNTGDYDQNSEVNVADLSQIALNYGATGPFDPESALWMVDGDFNGEINLADITPIAINYESTVTNYKIVSAPGGTPVVLGSIDFGNAIRGDGRRWSFVAEIVGAESGTPDVRSASYFSVYDSEGEFYWDYENNVVVIPNDDFDDGIESNPFFDEPGLDDADLALTNPPATGSGLFTDPYILYETDDLASNPFSFVLTHRTAGNLTNSDDTSFFVNEEGFGEFSSTTSGLFNFTVPSSQTGAFHAYAVNKDKGVYPSAIYFVMLPTTMASPVLALETPPAEGSGTQADPYIADVSTEYVFMLTSGETDVSIDSGTLYNTTPSQAGYISARDATLDIDDGFSGLVRITAEHFGMPNTTGSNVFMQVGSAGNNLPMIDSVVVDGATLTVEVSDFDLSDTLTVSVTEPSGLIVDSTSKVAMGEPLTATFTWTAENPFAGGSGTAGISVDDGNEGTDSSEASISIDGIVIEGDILYAIPQEEFAEVGEPVSLVIATSIPMSPFQFLNGVGLTVEAGMEIVPLTFNAGDIGGAANEADGFWTEMNPSSFLIPPDWTFIPNDIGGGLERWDFNLTPIGGSDVSTSYGNLFNLQVSFTAPGTYTFGFQEYEGVERTYYSDGASSMYFWEDITNDHFGFANSVTVFAGPELPALTLTNPPLQGDGSLISPFIVDVSTDYVFNLVDQIAGDVTHDSLTTYDVNKPAVGAIDTADATLNIEDTFTGGFVVSADYDGQFSNSLFMLVPSEHIYDPDTLYAIPQQTEAMVDEPITVLVSTGMLSSPFQFLLSVGLTIEDDASYVPFTFNTGSIGGAYDDADGIWSTITTDKGFILGADSNYIPGSDPEGTLIGLYRFDFNVSPLGGNDIDNAEGDLFNVQFSFSEPGVKTFGFQEYNGVSRTYYSSLGDFSDKFWVDLSNDNGMANSVTITGS